MSIHWPDKEELIKVGKGALIAAAGAGLTYLSEAISGMDFGELTPIVMVGWSVAANWARKALGL
jgi:hypothetical protein